MEPSPWVRMFPEMEPKTSPALPALPPEPERAAEAPSEKEELAVVPVEAEALEVMEPP
jgi:hypothetical protein